MGKYWLTFTRVQRKGLLMLFLMIVIMQFLILYLNTRTKEVPHTSLGAEVSWQKKTDSLKKAVVREKEKIYPFNPNFITDFKGYKLGMSTDEIDRLLAYRSEGKFVNSAQEFQLVTKVHSSWLAKWSPYFKFPDWVNNKRKFASRHYEPTQFAGKPEKVKIDINLATQEELIKVYGIGPALSERILKMKEKLGCFVSMGQMQDVWGLSDDVVENLKKDFFVGEAVNLHKLRINEANFKELMRFPYFNYNLTKEIVTYRSMNNKIGSPDDLIKINGFPSEKINIISLYLEF